MNAPVSSKSTLAQDSLVLHGGSFRTDPATAAVAVPIYQSTSFAFESTAKAARISRFEEIAYTYSRVANPTTDAFEQRQANQIFERLHLGGDGRRRDVHRLRCGGHRARLDDCGEKPQLLERGVSHQHGDALSLIADRLAVARPRRTFDGAALCGSTEARAIDILSGGGNRIATDTRRQRLELPDNAPLDTNRGRGEACRIQPGVAFRSLPRRSSATATASAMTSVMVAAMVRKPSKSFSTISNQTPFSDTSGLNGLSVMMINGVP